MKSDYCLHLHSIMSGIIYVRELQYNDVLGVFHVYERYIPGDTPSLIFLFSCKWDIFWVSSGIKTAIS